MEKAPTRSDGLGTRAITITIDGPAGTGKSTIARLLARRLGLEFLDTGAMYRAAALAAMLAGVDLHDGEAVARVVEESGMHFDWRCDPPRLWIERPARMDVTQRIREADINVAVSMVAAVPAVRRVLVERHRAICKAHPRLVAEGRDQGSVVFPDAAVKFYLDADPLERARRRAGQLREAGQRVDESAIHEDILRRDRADMERAVGPLIRPADAIVVDSTKLSTEEVVDLMERHVRKRLGEEVDG